MFVPQQDQLADSDFPGFVNYRVGHKQPMVDQRLLVMLEGIQLHGVRYDIYFVMLETWLLTFLKENPFHERCVGFNTMESPLRQLHDWNSDILSHGTLACSGLTLTRLNSATFFIVGFARRKVYEAHPAIVLRLKHWCYYRETPHKIRWWLIHRPPIRIQQCVENQGGQFTDMPYKSLWNFVSSYMPKLYIWSNAQCLCTLYGTHTWKKLDHLRPRLQSHYNYHRNNSLLNSI